MAITSNSSILLFYFLLLYYASRVSLFFPHSWTWALEHSLAQDKTKLTIWEVTFIIFGSAFALEEYTAATEHGWISKSFTRHLVILISSFAILSLYCERERISIHRTSFSCGCRRGTLLISRLLLFFLCTLAWESRVLVSTIVISPLFVLFFYWIKFSSVNIQHGFWHLVVRCLYLIPEVPAYFQNSFRLMLTHRQAGLLCCIRPCSCAVSEPFFLPWSNSKLTRNTGLSVPW